MSTPTTSPAPTRRTFLGQATALVAGVLLSRATPGRAAAPAAAKGKPNSVINGVRIGCISYSYRSSLSTAEEILEALLQNGLSEVELMGAPIQAYAGFVMAGGGKAKKAGIAPAVPYTDAQREAQLAKCRELRKLYNDAGVNIHLHKIPFGPTDDDVEFNFLAAKALGCVGLTTERSDALVTRLAPFAAKHRIWVGFHNHAANLPKVDETDPLVETGPYLGFNFDIGHYVAGTKGQSPIPVLEKYHDRIVSLHLKDRNAEGANLPWGEGQTPIKEVLQLMKKRQWKFPADIELEYKIPEGSDAVAEVAKCVQYCRAALA